MSIQTANLWLTLPIGTEHVSRSIINGNNQIIDDFAGDVDEEITGLEDGLAIVAVGNTHKAISAGQFVFVKKHSTLATGMYTANTDIGQNVNLTISNLTPDSDGIANALNSKIMQYATITATFDTTYGAFVLPLDNTYWIFNATTTDGFAVGVNYNQNSGKWVLVEELLKGQTKTVRYAYAKIG